ncbi:MAG: hypothetical protein DI586_04465 [Micavibrio aeruginosavorus]|uniref:HAD family hydrolase n=1 Tax=Micavibrio aeruginosavorus TaxID=349221 RepID=A0A2W5FMD9_9BACT|nr:MAG: hypothetical protein DI586_04465 [Micavibrio aeruginosavorus]
MRSPLPEQTPIKTLVILDKDNCELDTLEVFGALEATLAKIARSRQLPIELLHDLTREAEGEHRFNDAVSLIDHMNEIEPRFKTGKKKHIKSDISAKEDWLKKTSKLSTFYPGVLDTLKAWHDSGTNVVTKTDCERLPLIRRIWLTAINAYNDNQLKTPYEIISLYDHIYCKPSLGEPDNADEFDSYLRQFCQTSDVPPSFAAALNQHITVFRDGHKPSQSHMNVILENYPTRREHILYIGDNYKDGLEAQTVEPAVDFAWARYGADWKPQVRNFYSKVGSKSYRYGVEEIASMLELHGVNVRLVLETSLSDVLKHFDFQSGWNLPRRTLEDALKTDQQAARNPALYRVSMPRLGQ